MHRCMLLVALGLGHVGGLSWVGLLQQSGTTMLRPRGAPLPPCIIARVSRNKQSGPRQEIERMLDEGTGAGDGELTVGSATETAAPMATVVEEAVCGEAVFPLPNSEWHRQRNNAAALCPISCAVCGESLRVLSPDSTPVGESTNPVYAKLLAQALAVSQEGSVWKEFVAVNRDQFNFRFMYLLTAQTLAARNLGDESKAAELQEARVQIARESMFFDVPLFKQVGLAEGRLGQVLGLYVQGKPPAAADVQLAAGKSGGEVLAFWAVLAAAIAAWEAKLGTSVEDLARNKLKELNEVRAHIEDSADILQMSNVGLLARLLRLADPSLTGADTKASLSEVQAITAGLSESEFTLLLRRLGCLGVQLQRHSYQAYNPVVEKVQAIYDLMLHGELQPLETVPIHLTPREPGTYESGLMRLSEEYDDVLDEVGRELYW